MFHVGQKVVLVDDKWSDVALQHHTQLPVLGVVYVVRECYTGFDHNIYKEDMRYVECMGIKLIGITNPVNEYCREYGFNVNRFRALDWMKSQATQTQELALAK